VNTTGQYDNLGCRFGSHRVLEPEGTLPQPAWRIDNSMKIHDNEILLDVRTLNIDAASFTQLEEEAEGDPARIADRVLEIVGERGKMHNPVTGSGGMLIGKVREIGPALREHPRHRGLREGDIVCTLVSLSLTPLKLEEVLQVYPDRDQIDVRGQAVLFESGVYAKLPDDMSEKLALAVLDVAGAPAQTARLVKPGDTVLVIGAGGKSGLLCLYEAKKHAGVTGNVIGVGHSDGSVERARQSGFADLFIQGDATRPVEFYEKVMEVTGGEGADVTISNVNVPNCEMAAILSTRDDGVIYFFSMATSFTQAALGAEGIGHGANMIIGNGYAPGHAEVAIHCLRESAKLRAMFEELYG